MTTSRNIHQLLGSRALSEFSSNMYAIVLPLVILGLSGSLADVGIYYSMIKIPSVLLLPFIGIFVERISRKKLILGCNLLLLCLFIIQLIVFSSSEVTLLFLTVMGIGINVIASINDISTRVIFSEIVPKEQLEHYNGTKSVIDNTAIFLAPMLGTFLYGIFGIQTVLSLMLVFYGGASYGVYWVKYAPILSGEKDSGTVVKDLAEGLRFVKQRKSILAFFGLATTLNFFVASTEEIINPGILISKYLIPNQYFGFSSTFNILGIILAGVFIVRNKQIDLQQHLSKLFVINSLIMILIGGTSVLFQGRFPYVYYGIFLALQILLGFFTILINVPLTSYFQAHVPVNMQGRFFSFFSFAANLSIPFGIAYSGFLSERIGADFTYIINNLLVIVIVMGTYKFVDVLGSGSEVGEG